MKDEPEHPLTQSAFDDFWQSQVTDLIWRGKSQAASDLAAEVRDFHAACCKTADRYDSHYYRWHHERCVRWGGIWLAMLNVAAREEWHRKQRADRRAQRRKARS